MERLRDRGGGRPGIGVFYGHSGFGKTKSAIYVKNKTNAALVEVGFTWSAKTLLQRLCVELRVETKGTLAQLADRVVETLVDDDRPLIIDEADKLCDKGMIELVRQIHEESGAPILLLGEEKLPSKIAREERVHNRVLVWEPAQPCDLADARTLAKVYCPIEVADDLIEMIRTKSGGRARRIVVNLDLVADFARNAGLKALGAADYAGPFYTGDEPKPRGR
ncbi:AAA family ATPase [Blastochloris tepida]|nr:AAA family ATPase [Blastochloris tepida]